MTDEQKITLGRHTVEVYPQAVPYIERKLGRSFATGLVSGDADGVAIAGRLGGTSAIYRTLIVLVPGLEEKLPEHEFHGYPTEEAWKHADEDGHPDMYDRELAFTFPQLVDSLEVIWRVNRFDSIGLLEQVAKRFGLDPRMLGEWLQEALDRASTKEEEESKPEENGTASGRSSILPSPSGASA